MTHKCHAQGCERAVPPARLFCRENWCALPRDIRDAVWSTYRNGQESDKKPSREYIEAARAVINWLAAFTGKGTAS